MPVDPCVPNERLCGAVCADIGRDVHHCGACGYSCARDAVCVFGRCRLPSALRPTTPFTAPNVDPALRPTRTTHCPYGHAACGEGCVDLATSADHCGGCGNRCETTCSRGRCAEDGV